MPLMSISRSGADSRMFDWRVCSNAAWIIRVVNPKLRVIENVKGLSTELDASGFTDLEMFQQRKVEIQAVGIIQKISPGIPEGEPTRSNKLRRITNRADRNSERYSAALPIPS